MEVLDLPGDGKAQVERTSAPDVAVGLVTTGPNPALPAIAAAIRTGLEARLPGQTALVIHVDRAPSEETAAQLAQGLGDLRVVHASGTRALHGPDDAALDWSEAVQTVLSTGRSVEARTILMLNAEIRGVSPEWPGALVEPVLKEGCGLVLGVYQRNRYDGTLTQTLVIPFVRALFGRRLRQPLADEFACSADAAAFFLDQDIWRADLGQHGLPFWLPVAAVEHGVPLAQAVLGRRAAAPPGHPAPLGPTVGRVAGALFGLAERYETFWLEGRSSEPVRVFGDEGEALPGAAIDPERLWIGFSQGVRDLLPIWERVLAPENLDDVLALSEAPPGARALGDRLWARIVYDFLLAYRERVMYRSHLVQSLAPLYLGRAAALVAETRARPPAAVAEATDRLGQVFEDERPYLRDRWR